MGRIITLIAAVSENNVIGNKGAIPWKFSADLKHFRRLTINHPVIMGRKTWESLGGKPLDKRFNIIVTRDKSFFVPYDKNLVRVCYSIENALLSAFYKDDRMGFIIGGGEIYRQTIGLANRLELTRVHQNIEGDAYFPEIKNDEWKLADNPERFDGFSFESYVRR
jgi:dihydrofolate reductase